MARLVELRTQALGGDDGERFRADGGSRRMPA
jgi:hypothetical protein